MRCAFAPISSLSSRRRSATSSSPDRGHSRSSSAPVITGSASPWPPFPRRRRACRRVRGRSRLRPHAAPRLRERVGAGARAEHAGSAAADDGRLPARRAQPASAPPTWLPPVHRYAPLRGMRVMRGISDTRGIADSNTASLATLSENHAASQPFLSRDCDYSKCASGKSISRTAACMSCFPYIRNTLLLRFSQPGGTVLASWHGGVAASDGEGGELGIYQ